MRHKKDSSKFFYDALKRRKSSQDKFILRKIISDYIRMPYHLELGSDGTSFKGKAIVVNTQTGHHYSMSPIPLVKAKAQKRVLEMAMKKEMPK